MARGEETSQIIFKKCRKSMRQRRRVSDENDPNDDEDTVRSKLEELKTIQKFRQRPNGINIIGLATGATVSAVETITTEPFNLKAGGLVDMQAIKNGKKQNDEYIGTFFNPQTNKRDEDKEMLKYIEENIERRKNKNITYVEEDQTKYCSPEEAAFQAVPDYLKNSTSQLKNEEMLSNQMLSGIPEVDLGIETKFRNIEATEAAKKKLLWERHVKKDSPSQFVQYNRFNIQDPNLIKKVHMEKTAKQITKLKDKRKGGAEEKSTDDYHYERFKKRMRRF